MYLSLMLTSPKTSSDNEKRRSSIEKVSPSNKKYLVWNRAQKMKGIPQRNFSLMLLCIMAQKLKCIYSGFEKNVLHSNEILWAKASTSRGEKEYLWRIIMRVFAKDFLAAVSDDNIQSPQSRKNNGPVS